MSTLHKMKIKNKTDKTRKLKKKSKLTVPKSIETNSVNISNRKNVSWANAVEAGNDSEEKNRLPTTPYPKSTKKMKISANSTPITLAFDNSDSDDIFQNEITENKSKTRTTNQNKKRKRTKQKKIQSGWIVTPCTEKIKPDKNNLKVPNNVEKNSNNNEYNLSDDATYVLRDLFPEDLLKHILKSDASDDDSESPDELIPIDYYSSSFVTTSESSEEEIIDSDDGKIEFNPPIIKLNKNKCQIIEPKITSKKKTKKSKKKLPKVENNYDYNNSSHIEGASNETFELNNKTEILSPVNEINNMEDNSVNLESTGNNSELNNDLSDSVNLNSENNSEISSPEKQLPIEKQKINILDYMKFLIGQNYCLIYLKYPFKLYFNGKLSVIVLSGGIEVLGHTLKYDNEKEFEIYSPRGHCYLCFETIQSEKNPKLFDLIQKYTTDKYTVDFCDRVNNNDCVIAVRNIENKMSEYLRKHVAQYLYPSKHHYSNPKLSKLELQLNCIFDVETASLKLYKKHDEWPVISDLLLSKIDENKSRTILCGGKNVGKSTLLRYLINNMLNKIDKVVCIDLDPGQSEFTISGCVSAYIIDTPIFGPNYTHLKTPEKSFFIGDVNVVNFIDRYIESVQELIKYCEENLPKNLPWIVNYMGFSKSLGTDLVSTVIKLLNPNVVIQIESSVKNRNYISHLTPSFVKNSTPKFSLKMPNTDIDYTLNVLKSIAEEKISGIWTSESRLLREMCILSYLSQMLEDKSEISAVAPYGVKIPSLRLHNVNYTGDNILASLNANLVALCDINPDVIIDKKTVMPCLGFGIIRGVDKSTEELYLLTPVSEDNINKTNSLIRGNIALPPAIFMTTDHNGLVPYIMLGLLQGTSEIPKRSYTNWKALLKKK